MTELTLLDAAVLAFFALSIVRARTRALGDSLHDMIALLLLIALFMGFRMASELRQVLGGIAEAMRAIPGLGSKLLIIVGAWYLMRLLRKRSGYWIEKTVPRHMHRKITPVSEGLRAALLAGFVVWLAEGWFDGPAHSPPKVVQAVRAGEARITGMLSATLDRSTHQTRQGFPAPPHPQY
ncbi:MAG: hypothetical protein KDI82_10520 [Gammaproteobacteria bacterium]|nr:hypothetical protein [Gammaproteobacteria bacterium]